MRTVAKALTVGYKDNLQWWAGVELGRRLLLIVMVIALPGRTVETYTHIANTYVFHEYAVLLTRLFHFL